ncbi:MAG: chorismate mutase [Asticcacaulis sp.]
MRTLTDLRSEIDALDAELLRLVDQRAALGQAIGEAKARDEAATTRRFPAAPRSRSHADSRKLIAMPRQTASAEGWWCASGAS